MFKKNLVGWFEIYVQDMKRAKNFYENVFDIDLENFSNPGADSKQIDMWAFPGDMELYGAPGALVKMDGFPSGKNSVIIYFSCLDCAIEEKKVRSAGGKVQQSKMPIGQHGFISLIVDTEGNLIGLHTAPEV